MEMPAISYSSANFSILIYLVSSKVLPCLSNKGYLRTPDFHFVYSSHFSLYSQFTPVTAVVFLVFTLLYMPCVAAVATVKCKMGGVKAATGTVIVQCAIAWIVAFLVHGIGMVVGLA